MSRRTARASGPSPGSRDHPEPSAEPGGTVRQRKGLWGGWAEEGTQRCGVGAGAVPRWKAVFGSPTVSCCGLTWRRRCGGEGKKLLGQRRAEDQAGGGAGSGQPGVTKPSQSCSIWACFPCERASTPAPASLRSCLGLIFHLDFCPNPTSCHSLVVPSPMSRRVPEILSVPMPTPGHSPRAGMAEGTVGRGRRGPRGLQRLCAWPPGCFSSFPPGLQQSKPSRHDALCPGPLPSPSWAPSCPTPRHGQRSLHSLCWGRLL